MYPQDEIRIFVEYFPRNDTYMILRPDGAGYFSIDGQPEIFRRWGKSQIYVGYHGTYILRFEPHLIPCTVRISPHMPVLSLAESQSIGLWQSVGWMNFCPLQSLLATTQTGPSECSIQPDYYAE